MAKTPTMPNGKQQKDAPSGALDPRLRTAQKRLGHTFRDPSLLELALCHASTRNEGIHNNERLEFLGDAVLNMLVSWFLFDGLRDADEGTLSHRRSRMTQGDALAAVGKRLKLGEVLRTGKGQDLEPTSNMEADAVEACIGAIFLDAGLEAAQQFVLRHIIAGYRPEEPVYNDPKSRLQHYTLGRHLGLPEYRLINASGPCHEQVFHMEVLVGGVRRGDGIGRSKKLAQQSAADSALRALETEDAARGEQPPADASAEAPAAATPAAPEPAAGSEPAGAEPTAGAAQPAAEQATSLETAESPSGPAEPAATAKPRRAPASKAPAKKATGAKRASKATPSKPRAATTRRSKSPKPSETE